MYMTDVCYEVARVVIPPQCRDEVMQELHQAHPGINRIKSFARSYVWWPSMDSQLVKLCLQCDPCQLHNKLHFIPGSGQTCIGPAYTLISLVLFKARCC